MNRRLEMGAALNPRAGRLLAQLLGNTQRIIRVKYDHSNQKFSPRKLFPINPKTLGDYFLLKRIEADLSQLELAQIARFSVTKIKEWEHDKLSPTDNEWGVLEAILPLKTIPYNLKPNTGL
jgi:hypothetical protein